MVKFVEEELQKINSEVLEMWELVLDQMKNVCEAFFTDDKEKAWEVLIREKRVNACETKLDCDIEDFMARFNPVAIDLRFTIAMLKIITDLERIGDFAENIARFIIKHEEKYLDDSLLEKTRIREMADCVVEMLGMSKTAFEERDVAIAYSLFEKDNVLDEINSASTDALAQYVGGHNDKLAFCLDFKGVILRLERAGDHITNLAEEVIFYVNAAVLKHTTDKLGKDKALMHKLRGEDNEQADGC